MPAGSEGVTEVWGVLGSLTGRVMRVYLDEHSASREAARIGGDTSYKRLPLATPEMVADADRWRHVRDNCIWERRTALVGYDGDGNPIEEEWTFLVVRAPNGSDLSCAPMRDHAIDAARAAGGKDG